MSIDMYPDAFIKYMMRTLAARKQGTRVDHCTCPPDHPAHTSRRLTTSEPDVTLVNS